MFVDGDTPEAGLLQAQIDVLSVTNRDTHGEAGFVTMFAVPASTPRPHHVNLELTDVVATVEGMGPVQFMLRIEGGRVTVLEATSYGAWPSEPLTYTLRYEPSPRLQPVLSSIR